MYFLRHTEAALVTRDEDGVKNTKEVTGIVQEYAKAFVEGGTLVRAMRLPFGAGSLAHDSSVGAEPHNYFSIAFTAATWEGRAGKDVKWLAGRRVEQRIFLMRYPILQTLYNFEQMKTNDRAYLDILSFSFLPTQYDCVYAYNADTGKYLCADGRQDHSIVPNSFTHLLKWIATKVKNLAFAKKLASSAIGKAKSLFECEAGMQPPTIKQCKETPTTPGCEKVGDESHPRRCTIPCASCDPGLFRSGCGGTKTSKLVPDSSQKNGKPVYKKNERKITIYKQTESECTKCKPCTDKKNVRVDCGRAIEHDKVRHSSAPTGDTDKTGGYSGLMTVREGKCKMCSEVRARATRTCILTTVAPLSVLRRYLCAATNMYLLCVRAQIRPQVCPAGKYFPECLKPYNRRAVNTVEFVEEARKSMRPPYESACEVCASEVGAGINTRQHLCPSPSDHFLNYNEFCTWGKGKKADGGYQRNMAAGQIQSGRWRPPKHNSATGAWDPKDLKGGTDGKVDKAKCIDCTSDERWTAQFVTGINRAKFDFMACDPTLLDKPGASVCHFHELPKCSRTTDVLVGCGSKNANAAYDDRRTGSDFVDLPEPGKKDDPDTFKINLLARRPLTAFDFAGHCIDVVSLLKVTCRPTPRVVLLARCSRLSEPILHCAVPLYRCTRCMSARNSSSRAFGTPTSSTRRPAMTNYYLSLYTAKFFGQFGVSKLQAAGKYQDEGRGVSNCDQFMNIDLEVRAPLYPGVVFLIHLTLHIDIGRTQRGLSGWSCHGAPIGRAERR